MMIIFSLFGGARGGGGGGGGINVFSIENLKIVSNLGPLQKSHA